MGMLKNIIAPGIMLTFASPVLAASGPFFSLRNTDFVVSISFILFALVLVYLKVPSMLGKMLDQRAASIKTELDEARALREEAQTILASYERQQKEVSEQAARIVEDAKSEAKAAAEQANNYTTLHICTIGEWSLEFYGEMRYLHQTVLCSLRGGLEENIHLKSDA